MDELLDSQVIERKYKVASKGKRFTNYLIDVIAYYLFATLFGMMLGGVLVLTGNEGLLFDFAESSGGVIVDWLSGFIILITYYTFFEYLLKGKTLGKLLTKTRAVTANNERMDLSTTVKRSLCRIVPFEAFSFLGDEPTGWHDTWSSTKVIEDDNWGEY